MRRVESASVGCVIVSVSEQQGDGVFPITIYSNRKKVALIVDERLVGDPLRGPHTPNGKRINEGGGIV